MSPFKVAGLALAAGILGVILALVGNHLREDHALLEAIKADIISRQQQQMQAKPAPQPPVKEENAK